MSVSGGSRASVVLLYHRIAEEPVDPLAMCVSPRNFEEQLEVVRRVAEVVPASQVAASPPGSVAITFDDGYADVFSEALPRLERLGMHNTVFLVTDALETGRTYWWDRLVAAVFAGKPSEPLRLEIRGRTRRFGISNRVSQRIALRVLFPRLRAMDRGEQERLLADLEHGSDAHARRLPSPATRADVRSISSDFTEIGSHTNSHPSLSAIDSDDRVGEIGGSKLLLEERLGIEVRAFAYPFGARRTFDDEAVGDVREAGYTCAFTNISGSVRPGEDVFRIPRRVVGDWSGRVFEKRLRRWLGGR